MAYHDLFCTRNKQKDSIALELLLKSYRDDYSLLFVLERMFNHSKKTTKEKSFLPCTTVGCNDLCK